MDYFKNFINDEYDWIFDVGTDSSAILLDEYRDYFDEKEFEDNFELFRDAATELYINDEYYIQQIHENMDDCMRDVLNVYIADKEKFVNDHKPDEKEIEAEIKREIKEAYYVIKKYDNSKEVIKELAEKDSSCPEWLKDIVK